MLERSKRPNSVTNSRSLSRTEALQLPAKMTNMGRDRASTANLIGMHQETAPKDKVKVGWGVGCTKRKSCLQLDVGSKIGKIQAVEAAAAAHYSEASVRTQVNGESLSLCNKHKKSGLTIFSAASITVRKRLEGHQNSMPDNVLLILSTVPTTIRNEKVTYAEAGVDGVGSRNSLSIPDFVKR
jgi:hypothetical protein